MSGIGFVRDAQSNAKRNRDNLKNKTNFTKTYKSTTPNTELSYKEATPEELAKSKAQFAIKQRKRRIRDIILLISIAIILVFIGQLLFQ